MTIRTLNGGFFFPQPWGGQASGRFVSNTTSVAVLNDRVAFVFDAPATGTITGCTIWVATNTAGIDCRLETVNGAGATAGTPTGTLAGTNTNVAIASGSTGAQTVTFTGSYSATIGDRLSITINQTGVGTVALATPTLAAQPPGAGGGSLVWKETAGTWAVQARVMAMALNYGGTYYYIPGCFAVDSAATYTGNIGSGAERGIQFKLPYKTQVMGWFTLYAPSGAGRLR